MELRMIAERMKALSEYLRGMAWIGMGVVFLSIVMIVRKSCKRRGKGKKWARKKAGKFFLVFGIWAVSSTLMTEIAVYGEEEIPQIRIVREEEPAWEKDSIWYYGEPFILTVIGETEEKEEKEEKEKKEEKENQEQIPGEKQILIRIQERNTKGEWEELKEEEFSEKGIAAERTEEGVWEISFSKEIRCRVTGIWERRETPEEEDLEEENLEEEDSEEKDSEGEGYPEESGETICKVQQEVVLDQSAPVEAGVSVLRGDREEEIIQEKGFFYSKERIRVRVISQDETGVGRIICEGRNPDTGQISFVQETEGETAEIILPEDFRGRLTWRMQDHVGNERVWEQPGNFCAEALEKHRETAGLLMEITEETPEGIQLKICGWDTWSGLRKIWMKRGERLIWEEWMDQGETRICTWENIMEVPFFDEKEIKLTVVLEDRVGHQKESSLFVKGRKNPQEEQQEEVPGEEPEAKPEAKPEPEPGGGSEENPETGQETEEFLEPWLQDKNPPQIQISGAENGKSYNSAVKLSVSLQDLWLDQEKSVCSLYGERQGQIFMEQKKKGEFFWDAGREMNRDDRYHLEVIAWDKGGNMARERISFSINRRGSIFEVLGMEHKDIFHDVQELVITEENLSQVVHRTFMCIWEGTPRMLTENVDYYVEKEERENWIYRYRFAPELFQREGRYTIHILTEDQVGNKRSNLHFYDGEKTSKKLPVEFYVSREKNPALVQYMESGGLYFQKKEPQKEYPAVLETEKTDAMKRETKEQGLVAKKILKTEEMGETEEKKPEAGKEKQEKTILKKEGNGGIVNISGIGSWILAVGAALLYRGKKMFRH